jgi:hypothetical protein
MDHGDRNTQGCVNAGGNFNCAGSFLTACRRGSADSESSSILGDAETHKKEYQCDYGD